MTTQLANGRTAFHGRVDAAGVSVAGKSGFTVVWNGTFNKYTVTHGLGDANYSVCISIITTSSSGVPQGTPEAFHYIPFNSSFEVQFAGGVQNDFSFILIPD